MPLSINGVLKSIALGLLADHYVGEKLPLPGPCLQGRAWDVFGSPVVEAHPGDHIEGTPLQSLLIIQITVVF